jgi:hypothetical protein
VWQRRREMHRMLSGTAANLEDTAPIGEVL